MKTYGNLSLDRERREWQLTDLEPHVTIAFKRLFPRVPTTATVIRVSDADDVRADLDWFMHRFPLAHAEHDALREALERIAATIAERDRILLPSWTPPATMAFRPGYQPYLYQSQAAQIALRNPGLLLGDDVGLGKTISAIAVCTMGAPLPAAVVVQAHLADQWAARIEEFTTLRAHVIKGTTPYSLPPADIYIFRYSNVAGWTSIIAEDTFKTVIFDEMQELRHGRGTNKGNACYSAARRAQLRMGLTATPIYNYGDEIFNIMDFIQPDLLGKHDEFAREWCSGKIVKNPDGLGSYLRDKGYFLRRSEDDETVAQSMPPPNIIDWEVDYDQAAADDEAALTRMLAQTVLTGSFVEAGRAARELDLKMRQMTGVAKARPVAAYVRMLLKDAPRVLLAGWHREVYSIWERELAEFSPVLYTGSESAAGKGRSVEAFTTGDSRVMMISLRSGVGLDGLQHHCQDVVFGELDWSPQVHYQIIGRLRRPGQRHQVSAHYLHTNGGSDPVLLETLGIKTDQSRGITQPGKDAAERFTDDSRIKRLAAHILAETEARAA